MARSCSNGHHFVFFLTSLPSSLQEFHGWKRRWFVLEDNKLTYFKDQNDTEPVAAMALENCTSLHRNSDVSPKKLEQCAFALDIKEHKQVRTYYLSAHSETEKKQWLDAMLASKKWYAAQSALVLKGMKSGGHASGPPRGGGASTAQLEQDLEESKDKLKRLMAENRHLKKQLEEALQNGGGEDMLLELEEMEERYNAEKRKRIHLEQQEGGGIDEAELDDLRDKYEEEIHFLKAQHAKELRAATGAKPKKGAGGNRGFEDSGSEDFDVPEFEDSFEETKPKIQGGKRDQTREIEMLKKENARLKQSAGRGGPDLEDLEDEVAELNALVDKLSGDVTTLQREKASLEARLMKGGAGGGDGDLEDENAELRGQVQDLERHLDELEAVIAQKNEQIRRLDKKKGGGNNGEADELRKKLELMEGVLEDLEQEIQDLKDVNDELEMGGGREGGSGRLESENETLRVELATAQTQAQGYKQKLNLLRSEYKKLLARTNG